MKTGIAVGLMSGTSADGVSLAAVRFRGRSFQMLACRTYPYRAPLRRAILNAVRLKTPELSRLNFELGHLFADKTRQFLRAARLAPRRVEVIGSHGQTVYHGPLDRPANTLQIGEPSILAEKTGIPVVADFRPRDIAAGGEGAPLIPFFDDYFFGNGPARALQNIGGIANVTLAGRGVRPAAFDNGPGNTLIDRAVQRLTRGRQAFDRGGRLARRGHIDMNIVLKMARHAYFSRKPPKSTGPELFDEKFIPAALLRQKPEDVIASLTFFTAYVLSQSYLKFLRPFPREVIVSGGGALNPVLMDFLRVLLRPVTVRSIADYGLHPQAKEPAAFAFFALQAVRGRINHLPQASGARRACILGKIIPGWFFMGNPHAAA